MNKEHRKVDLYKNVGVTNVITSSTPLSQRGGFFCDTCDCLLRDSISFLDHINGKKHQKLLGMHMVVKKSTVEDIKERLKLIQDGKKEEVTTEKMDIVEKMQKEELKAKLRKMKKRRKRH